MGDYLLSTEDNPYNPHTEWEEWLAWDTPRYNTLALLGRVVVTSDDLPFTLEDQEINDAMKEIVDENVSGKHILVPASTDA